MLIRFADQHLEGIEVEEDLLGFLEPCLENLGPNLIGNLDDSRTGSLKNLDQSPPGIPGGFEPVVEVRRNADL